MTARAAALPVLAAVLVSGVVGVQLGNGGGDYVPARAADPCAYRVVTSVDKGIDGLSERLVLLGLDSAACRLGVTREALVLDLATKRSPTDAQVGAMRAGLLDAVDKLKKAGTLPKASELTNEAVDDSDLNGFVKALIKALPDSLIDKSLATDDVLKRTIRNLDLRTLLADANDSDAINRQIRAAVTKAVKDALIAKLRDLI